MYLLLSVMQRDTKRANTHALVGPRGIEASLDQSE